MNSKLLSFGIAIMTISIISTGMLIYNNSMDTVQDSMIEMEQREVEAFNNNFISFEGKQTGSSIKSLLGTLIANANTYKDEPTKIPAVIFDKVNNDRDSSVLEADIPDMSNPQPYITSLNQIRNFVEPKHQYWVAVTYQDNGLIDAIYVFYDADNPNIDDENMYIQKHSS